MTVRCETCGTAMKPTIRDYRYEESGLGNVILERLRVYRCPKCRTAAPEIPNVLGLHQTIARALLTKPVLLTGAEIRFLRRHGGLKAAEFAARLGTTPVTVSRWETGNIRVDGKTDRLIRLLCVRKLEEGARRLLFPGFYEVVTRLSPSARRSTPIRISRRQLRQSPWMAASA